LRLALARRRASAKRKQALAEKSRHFSIL